MRLSDNGGPVPNEIGIPGVTLQVAADGQIERRDFSGESSGGAGVHGGWKPWRVACALTLSRDEPALLGVLRFLFDAADDAGEPVVEETDALMARRQPFFCEPGDYRATLAQLGAAWGGVPTRYGRRCRTGRSGGGRGAPRPGPGWPYPSRIR